MTPCLRWPLGTSSAVPGCCLLCISSLEETSFWWFPLGRSDSSGKLCPDTGHGGRDRTWPLEPWAPASAPPQGCVHGASHLPPVALFPSSHVQVISYQPGGTLSSGLQGHNFVLLEDDGSWHQVSGDRASVLQGLLPRVPGQLIWQHSVQGQVVIERIMCPCQK